MGWTRQIVLAEPTICFVTIPNSLLTEPLSSMLSPYHRPKMSKILLMERYNPNASDMSVLCMNWFVEV